MKIPALKTPQNAVNASNMVTIPKAQRSGPNCTGRRTVKGIPGHTKFCRRGDDFLQHASIGFAGSGTMKAPMRIYAPLERVLLEIISWNRNGHPSGISLTVHRDGRVVGAGAHDRR
jgi:hypothetical protein